MKKTITFLSVLALAFSMVFTACDQATIESAPEAIINAVTNDDYYATAEIGDYILKDGIICKQADLTAENKSNVVAVIFRKATLLTPALGVAVEEIGLSAWATVTPNEAQGYNKNISELVWNDTTKAGLKDGSKSLELLIQSCPDYVSFSDRYPAWKNAASFGKDKGYKTLKDGWYISTVSEIMEIADNISTINSALNNISSAKRIIDGFWTSNQESSNNDRAYTYNFNSKVLFHDTKGTKKCVRPIRAFSSKNVDYNKAKAGDIVFENGLFADADDYCSNAKVAAIIFRAADGTNPAMGVGLVKGSNLSWCTNTAQGYAKIESLTEENTKRSADAYAKLDVIANLNNYPAWKYCATYGVTNNLSKMFLGWTLPSVEEIKALYTNKTAVNNAVTKINTVSGSSLTAYTEYFWSCNQSSNAVQARIKDAGSNQPANKDAVAPFSCRVIAVREFTSNEVVKQTVATPVVTGIGKDGNIKTPKQSDGSVYWTIEWGSNQKGKVYITCATPEAVIYYYVQASDAQGQLTYTGLYKYTGQFEPDNGNLVVFAVKDGYNPSEIKKYNFADANY